jgi:hypothetical protein
MTDIRDREEAHRDIIYVAYDPRDEEKSTGI